MFYASCLDCLSCLNCLNRLLFGLDKVLQSSHQAGIVYGPLTKPEGQDYDIHPEEELGAVRGPRSTRGGCDIEKIQIAHQNSKRRPYHATAKEDQRPDNGHINVILGRALVLHHELPEGTVLIFSLCQGKNGHIV